MQWTGSLFCLMADGAGSSALLRQLHDCGLQLRDGSALDELADDGLALLDLQLLAAGGRLPVPLECLLGRGRWLLINAAEPFLDDFLLFYPGVYGLLPVGSAPERILQALRVVERGELWLSRRFLAEVFQRQRARQLPVPVQLPPLTRREWQVVRGLLAAENNRQIGERLGVEESTVKRHLYNLFRKIGVRNRLEALNWARAIGLSAGQEFRPATDDLRAG